MIQKATSSPTNEEPKHYILMPFFSHQRAMVQHLERYYREQCFVGLLPYLRDQNDYRQLIDVLGHFADQLQPIGTAETRDIEALEALLEDARS